MAGLEALMSLFGGGDSGGGSNAPVQLSGPADPNAIQDRTSPNWAPNQGGGFDISKILGAAVPAIGGIASMFQGGGADGTMKQLAGLAKPMQAAGNQALSSYTSGKLSPGQQATVDQMKQRQLAQYRQYMARAGIPESSAMADMNAKVEQDAMVESNKLLQQDFTNALNATGLAGTGLSQLAQYKLMQDKQQRETWQAFMNAMGKLGTDVGPMLFGGNNP